MERGAAQAELLPEQLVAIAQQQKTASIAYTYNEPTIFFEYTYDTAKLAHAHGIKNVYVSNGFMSPETLERLTPYLDGTNLTGITRDCVISIARDLGIGVREGPVAREALYTADELFFTGTATEVTPIRSVDKIPVGEGKAGPVTLSIQRRFMGIAQGREPDTWGWLDRV